MMSIAPLSGPTRMADPNRFWDTRLILFIYLFFFSKVSRPESPTQPEWRIQTRAQFTPIVFIYLIRNILFMSFHFSVFNYAEAVSSGRPINIYFYTIRLQNGLSCLYKMIYKKIVQRLTLLFTKCHTFEKNGMHMTRYILISRNFLYDFALLDLAFFHVYSKFAHR